MTLRTLRWVGLVALSGTAAGWALGAKLLPSKPPLVEVPQTAPSELLAGYFRQSSRFPLVARSSAPQTLSRSEVERRLTPGLVISGRTPHRMLLFSFDDGPHEALTPRLLDLLDHFGMRALFFLVGERIAGDTARQQRQASLAKQLLRRGHLVGNHSMHHDQLPLLSSQEAATDIARSTQVFREVLGFTPRLYRAPGGARSPRIDALLRDAGYAQIMWNLGTGDVQVRHASDVLRTFRRVLRREQEAGSEGGIVLLHDLHAWSVEGFRRIVHWIARENCRLIRLKQALYDIVDHPRFFPAADATDGHAAAALDPSEVEARQAVLRQRARHFCAQQSSKAPR